MHYSLNEQLETVPYTVICYIQVSLKEGLTILCTKNDNVMWSC